MMLTQDSDIYCGTTITKEHILNDELVALLFDNTNINHLNPGIFFIEIEKRFLKKQCSLYNMICDPVSIKLDMIKKKSKDYYCQYIISLDCGKPMTISLNFTIYFFIQAGVLWFKCQFLTNTSMKVQCRLCLECNDISIYNLCDIAGGNEAHTYIKVIQQNVLNKPLIFKISIVLCSCLIPEISQSIIWTYHSIFGVL